MLRVRVLGRLHVDVAGVPPDLRRHPQQPTRAPHDATFEAEIQTFQVHRGTVRLGTCHGQRTERRSRLLDGYWGETSKAVASRTR